MPCQGQLLFPPTHTHSTAETSHGLILDDYGASTIDDQYDYYTVCVE